ncbi:MAG: T9SS type A sorting domain-containing protein [Bacteroidota bacterium]|nr:T9SS type A sorting domain-containing protein [Bacteroidota bacterium]
MKKAITLYFLCISFVAFSQTEDRFHIQSYSFTQADVLSKDTVYFALRNQVDSRIGWYNPTTGDWGIPADSGLSENLFLDMAIHSGGKGILTSDLGKSYTTLQRGSDIQLQPLNPYLEMVLSVQSGFIGTRTTSTTNPNSSFFSQDGINWDTIPIMDLQGEIPSVATKGPKVILFLGTSTRSESTDGGFTFTQVGTTTPVSGNIVTASAIADDTTYYVYTRGNSLRKTTDGGSSWVTLGGAPSGIVSLVFPSRDTGFFATSNMIYVTWDGGQNILPASSQPPTNLNRDLEIQQGRLFCGGNSWSDNWGQTWSTFRNISQLGLNSISDVHFFGTQGIAVGNQGRFILTTDGGKQFSQGAFPISSGDVERVFQYSPTKIIAVDNFGKIFLSTDGGTTFSQKGSLSSTFSFFPIKAGYNGRIHIQVDGEIALSRDEGSTFQNISVPGTPAMSMTGLGTTWSARNLSNQVRIEKYEPLGGAFTMIKNLSLSGTPIALKMVSETTGYLFLLNNGTVSVYRTTNEWQTVALRGAFVSTTSIPTDWEVFNFSTDTLVVTLNSTLQFRSTNGGTSWAARDIPILSGGNTISTTSTHCFSVSDHIIGSVEGMLFMHNFGTPDQITPVGIEEEYLRSGEFKISIYPNPATEGWIQIKVPEQQFPLMVSLIDLSGNVISQWRTADGRIEVPEIPTGVYLIKVEVKGITYFDKLIIR